MKRTVIIIAALIFFSIVGFAKPYSDGPGFTYNFIRGYCIGLGYNIGQEWNCDLEQGEYFTKTFTFSAGVEYNIVALSENDNIKDVDIQILWPNGDVYVQDTKSDKFAEVNFTPSYTYDLTIKVINYSSYNPYYSSKVYFLVAYKY